VREVPGYCTIKKLIDQKYYLELLVNFQNDEQFGKISFTCFNNAIA